jgi:hypothetical protein
MFAGKLATQWAKNTSMIANPRQSSNIPKRFASTSLEPDLPGTPPVLGAAASLPDLSTICSLI